MERNHQFQQRSCELFPEAPQALTGIDPNRNEFATAGSIQKLNLVSTLRTLHLTSSSTAVLIHNSYSRL